MIRKKKMFNSFFYYIYLIKINQIFISKADEKML